MDLSVVVPAYREGRRIHGNLVRLLAELDQLEVDYEVVVVSDGNTDETVTETERVASGRVRLVQYPVNMGKGYALCQGVAASTGDLVTFIDADMELHPKEIKNFISTMESGQYDIVIGSKRHPQSRVKYPLFRRFQSLCYQLLIRALFRLDVRDTQTGLKLLRRKVVSEVVPVLAVKRFAFDLELLVVAREFGYRRVAEAPVELDYQFESTIRPSTVYRILWDTAAIFYRLRIKRYYAKRREELSRAGRELLPQRIADVESPL